MPEGNEQCGSSALQKSNRIPVGQYADTSSLSLSQLMPCNCCPWDAVVGCCAFVTQEPEMNAGWTELKPGGCLAVHLAWLHQLTGVLIGACLC